MAELNYRWPARIPPEEIKEEQIIHARVNSEAEFTLCEQDGPLVPFGSVALDLTTPKDKIVRPVNCPGCLAWMHA